MYPLISDTLILTLQGIKGEGSRKILNDMWHIERELVRKSFSSREQRGIIEIFTIFLQSYAYLNIDVAI